MPRHKQTVDSNTNHSTGATLLRLSMALGELDPTGRAVILSTLVALEDLAGAMLRLRQSEPKPRAKVVRRAKAVKKAKPVKRRKNGVRLNYDPNRLIALRLNEKISQGELAKRIKVHFTTISTAEKGRASAALLAKLSKYFNTQLLQDVEPEVPMPPPPAARLVKHTNGSDE